MNTMTEIILVRHGETEWNAARRLQGHTDIGLNALGRRQAAALGRALAVEPVAAIYSSDLQRALHTAQAVAASRTMTVAIDAALRERCYGGFEGVTHDDLPGLFPDAYAAMQRRDEDARFPDGERRAETLRKFSRRSVDAIVRLAQAHRGETIVIVAHGGVLECLYREARQIGLKPARDFEILNASINRLRWDGTAFHIDAWSIINHLDQESMDEMN